MKNCKVSYSLRIWIVAGMTALMIGHASAQSNRFPYYPPDPRRLDPRLYEFPDSAVVAIVSIQQDNFGPGIPRMPSISERLLTLTKDPRTSHDEVCASLMRLIPILGQRAICALGDLRCKKASGMLADIARTRGDPQKYWAIRAVVQIGDTNMLDFAKEVVGDANSEHFGYGDRLGLYEALSPYLGLCSWKAVPVGDDERINVDVHTRRDVQNFLVSIIASVPGFGGEYRVDEILCAASEQWRKSHERQAFLERFKDTDNTTYYADQLRALQAIPAAERTHVEVHPLRMDSPAPPAQPQPAPSTNAPASPVSQPAP